MHNDDNSRRPPEIEMLHGCLVVVRCYTPCLAWHSRGADSMVSTIASSRRRSIYARSQKSLKTTNGRRTTDDPAVETQNVASLRRRPTLYRRKMLRLYADDRRCTDAK